MLRTYPVTDMLHIRYSSRTLFAKCLVLHLFAMQWCSSQSSDRARHNCCHVSHVRVDRL